MRPSVDAAEGGKLMRRRHAVLALWVMLMPFKLAAQAPPTASADQLFKAGKFAEAQAQYSQIATEQPNNYHAVFSLGRIALLSNKLDDSENCCVPQHMRACLYVQLSQPAGLPHDVLQSID